MLPALFFTSGFAALLYQTVWQRSLFLLYGVNVESVAIVVTAFMLGLGVGSLAGGALSREPSRPTALMFSLLELGLGLFGAASLTLFHAVGKATLAATPLVVAVVTFLLLLVPTVLMGATLPLLLAHFARRTRNVGASVAVLYFVNTLGSALAALVAVSWLFGQLGLSRTVGLAVVLNLIAATGAAAVHLRDRPLRLALP